MSNCSYVKYHRGREGNPQTRRYFQTEYKQWMNSFLEWTNSHNVHISTNNAVRKWEKLGHFIKKAMNIYKISTQNILK